MSTLHVRWMINRDLDAVIALDGNWTREKFLDRLRQRNCIGMVVEEGEIIVGFMVYELLDIETRLLRFTALPNRPDVGWALWVKLQYKHESHRRPQLTLPDGFQVPTKPEAVE